MRPEDTVDFQTKDEDFANKVYDELLSLAHAKMFKEFVYSTIQGTALVHDAWLRLGGDAKNSDRPRPQATK